jgi:hypothetical protein
MAKAEQPKLDWHRQASANLRKYLAQLEESLAAGQSQGIDLPATEQLIAEVKRRLSELEKLLAADDRTGG